MDNFVSRHVPELDGLRGIAIISVLIHHQMTPFSLKGGFLGVDLFFVLSGFLITGLLLGEFDSTGAISLKRFYFRRVLRLGPALILYLLGCIVVAQHTQLISLGRQTKLIALALVYATNWRMAFSWDPVLDPTAIIWSLSIEEQFYLVWPVLLCALLAFSVRRRYIAGGLVITIAAILIHRNALLNSGSELTRLYYGTDTRADAILTGCLLAFLPTRFLDHKAASRWLNVAGVLSVGGLIICMAKLGFSTTFLYQGGFTLVAVLCGIVVLTAGHRPPAILSTFLAAPLLRWFGRISYGLYLWHWLIIQNTSFYYLGRWEPWARLALALVIASTSFYVVEKPFNKLKKRFASRATPVTTKQRPVEQPIPTIPIPVTN